MAIRGRTGAMPDIAKEFGVSRSQISRIERKWKGMLKEHDASIAAAEWTS